MLRIYAGFQKLDSGGDGPVDCNTGLFLRGLKEFIAVHKSIYVAQWKGRDVLILHQDGKNIYSITASTAAVVVGAWWSLVYDAMLLVILYKSRARSSKTQAAWASRSPV